MIEQESQVLRDSAFIHASRENRRRGLLLIETEDRRHQRETSENDEEFRRDLSRSEVQELIIHRAQLANPVQENIRPDSNLWIDSADLEFYLTDETHLYSVSEYLSDVRRQLISVTSVAHPVPHPLPPIYVRHRLTRRRVRFVEDNPAYSSGGLVTSNQSDTERRLTLLQLHSSERYRRVFRGRYPSVRARISAVRAGGVGRAEPADRVHLRWFYRGRSPLYT